MCISGWVQHGLSLHSHASWQAAPFDWSYAQLGPIRAFLQKEIDEGRFVPTLNLPL